MTSSPVAHRIGRWLHPDVPRSRLVAVRLLVATFAVVYVVARLPYFADVASQDPARFAPVGIARVLSSPLPAAVGWPLALATVALGVAFALGARARLTGPLFFLLLLWLTTYKSSWGKILHSENLVVLHVGVLALASPAPSSARGPGWTLRTLSIVTVLTYLVAGIAKLRSGGAAWLSGDALAKWLAFDTLRKIELGSLSSPLAPLVASHRALTQALALFTMLVELGAPLALVSRRAGRYWCVLAWSFHVGILATMAIGFFYPLTFIAFASFFEPERLLVGLRPPAARDPPT